MALSFTRRGSTPYTIVGAQKRTVTDCTFDSSYVTGGEVWTAANLGLNSVDTAHVGGLQATGAGVNVASAQVDLSAKTILLSDETPAQVANAADVSTTVVRVIAYGK